MSKNSGRKWHIQWAYGIIRIVVIMVSFLWTAFLWKILLPQKSSFEPKIMTEGTALEGLLGVNYNYYLDFSPSMEGFFSEGLNSSMFRLSNALEELNSNYQSTHFYRCTSVVEPLSDAASFYDSMTSETNLQYLYNGEVAAETITEKIREIDLTTIWTDRYTDGDIYHSGTGNVNVIITDMNFRESEWDEEGYSSRINDFAGCLGEAAKNSNIHIYNLFSAFKGSVSDEYYIPSDEESVEPVDRNEYEGTRPFFLIVLSDDNEAYLSYIQELENNLEECQIDYSNDFELVNNVAYAAAGREEELEYYVRNNEVVKTGFNFDNDSFKQLDGNEIAFQMIMGSEPSEIMMPILRLELPGYYYSGDVSDLTKRSDNTVIEVVSRVYYPYTKLIPPLEVDYQEDTASNIITYKNAEMFWQQGGLYLRTSIGMNNTVNMPAAQGLSRRVGVKPHFVVYFQFYIESPDYHMPSWVHEINCDAISSEAKILNIETVFSQIIYEKKTVYATRDASERYLGDAVFYITYAEE